MTRLRTARWAEQVAGWPASGRHLMAQYDDASIVVYQAYRPEIADLAVREQAFGPPFGLGRMSWVKPNFLWMMYRCGWATKPDQERVLAVRLPRPAFEAVLRRYALEWPLEIEDVTGFVAEQREVLRSGRTDELLVPVESPYPCPKELL